MIKQYKFVPILATISLALILPAADGQEVQPSPTRVFRS